MRSATSQLLCTDTCSHELRSLCWIPRLFVDKFSAISHRECTQAYAGDVLVLWVHLWIDIPHSLLLAETQESVMSSARISVSHSFSCSSTLIQICHPVLQQVAFFFFYLGGSFDWGLKSLLFTCYCGHFGRSGHKLLAWLCNCSCCCNCSAFCLCCIKERKIAFINLAFPWGMWGLWLQGIFSPNLVFVFVVHKV